MKNSLITDLEEEIKNLRSYLRSIKKKPQLYYYEYGTCIFERLYNNDDWFQLTNSEVQYRRSEEDLIERGATKIYYEKEIT